MDAACDEALNQIEKKSYVDKLKQDGMRNFIKLSPLSRTFELV